MKNAISVLCFGFLVLNLGAQDVPISIDKQIQQQASDAPLRMQFRGKTADDCRRWQAEFAKKLRSLLGPFDPPKTWRTTIERTVELADHRRLELVLVAKGAPPLPLHLLIPKDKGKKRAGIVAVHGHGQFGHDLVAGRELTPGMDDEIKRLNADYGRELVRRGYVVAVPCLTPFGRRLGDRKAYGNNDPCAITFVRLQLLGKVLMAENLRDILWCVNLLAGHDDVDADRLGCVGLSYGGRMTMLAAALEPRIKVAIISGALNCLQERIQGRYSCGAQVIPGLLQYGEIPEIASLVAPRPCLWEVGDKDTLLPRRWQEIALKRIGRAYEALGAKEQLQVNRFDGGHQWHGKESYRLLARVLDNTPN